MNKFSKVFAVAVLCSSVGLSAVSLNPSKWFGKSATEKYNEAKTAAAAEIKALDVTKKPADVALSDDEWLVSERTRINAKHELLSLSVAAKNEDDYNKLTKTEKATAFAKARLANLKSVAWNWNLVEEKADDKWMGLKTPKFLVNKVALHMGIPAVVAVAAYKMRQNSVRAAEQEADEFGDEEDFEVAN